MPQLFSALRVLGRHTVMKSALMCRKLYVGDASVSADESEIRQLLSTVGTVETTNVVSDHRMGKPHGAFVEMATDAQAAQAIADPDQAEIDGRAITVDEAGPDAIQDESRFVTAFAI